MKMNPKRGANHLCYTFAYLIAANYFLHPLRDAQLTNSHAKSTASSLVWQTSLLSLFLSPVAKIVTNGPIQSTNNRLCLLFAGLSLPLLFCAWAGPSELLAQYPPGSASASQGLPLTGYVFHVASGILNLFTISLLWAHAGDLLPGHSSHLNLERCFRQFAVYSTIGQGLASLLSFIVITFVPGALPHHLLIGAIISLIGAGIHTRRAGYNLISTELRGSSTKSTNRDEIGSCSMFGSLSKLKQLIGLPFTSDIMLYLATYTMFYSMTISLIYLYRVQHISSLALQSQAQAQYTIYCNAVSAILTFVIQVWMTSTTPTNESDTVQHSLKYALLTLPSITMMGFALVMCFSPFVQFAPIPMGVFEIARRAAAFAVAKPSKELMFTAVDQSEKYGGKVFIDLVVYKTSMSMGAWVFNVIEPQSAGWLVWSLSLLLVVIVWFLVSLRLYDSFSKTNQVKAKVE